MGRSRTHATIHRPNPLRPIVQRRRYPAYAQTHQAQATSAISPHVVQNQTLQNQTVQNQTSLPKGLSSTASPSSLAPLEKSQNVLARIQAKPMTATSGIMQRTPGIIQRNPDKVWGAHDFALDEMARSNKQGVRNVLRKNFFSNWFLAQDCLVSHKWPGNKNIADMTAQRREKFTNLMRALLWVRRKDTNELLMHIRDEALPRQNRQMRRIQPAERLSWSAAGSDTLTSDIDVNLKGAGSIQAVGLFNKLFKTQYKFPYDPGTVYDVNVYAQDFMTPGRTETLMGGHKKLGSPFQKQQSFRHTDLIPQEEVPPFTDEDSVAFETFSINQDVWSMTKMRMYMTQEEWNQYKADMLGTEMTEEMIANDPDGFQQKEQMRGQLLDAEHYYRMYKARIEQKVEEIEDETQAKYAKLRAALANSGDSLSHERQQDAKEMVAANEIYEEKLNRVQELRSELNALKRESPRNLISIKTCGLKLKNALSEAIMFSNEAYFSQGAVQDVVLGYQIGQGMQNKKRKGNAAKGQAPEPDYTVDLQLANNLRLQSMREQVGDTLKILTEYANEQAWKAVYKAGKYIDRMILAARPLLPDQLSGGLRQDLRLIQRLGRKATQLKSEGAAAGTIQAQLNQLLGGLSVADVRRLIIRIGTIVEQHYRQVW